jgi:tetratricopeptide (TPR) repeat protein
LKETQNNMLINKLFGFSFFLVLLAGVGEEVRSDGLPGEIFNKANSYYQEAVYDSALVLYKQIEEKGLESAQLYYNLGNTYFKLNKLPYAILYYEKAKKLKSNDDDLLHNLDLANSMIVDKIEAVPQLFFRLWWKWFYDLFSADLWAWLSVILLAFTLAMTYLFLASERIVWRKTGFFSGLVGLLFTILAFGLASQKYYYTQRANEAIIFTPTITAKSSPSNNSVDLFVIHEGTKVLLLDETSGWKKIRLANGSIGWLPAESLTGI